MPTLSKHYALLDFDPGNPASVPIEPISVDVQVDETWSPYCQATVIIPNDIAPYTLDPRFPTFLGLRLQQDFGDLIYNYELTASFGGDVSTITAAYAGTQTTRTNKATNPSFEAGVATLSGSGGTVSQFAGGLYGNYCGRFTYTVNQTGSSSVLYGSNTQTTTTAGTAHTISIYVKSSRAVKARIELYPNGGSYGPFIYGAGTQLVANTWTRLSATITPNSPSIWTQIRVATTSDSSAWWQSGDTVDLDGVLIEASSTLRDYFDGSLPDGLNLNNNWTGTPNASTSTQLTGDLVNAQEITRDYSQPWNIFETSLPLSTVTTAYGGDVSNITAAGLTEIWRVSDFLHSSGTFNPAPSTIFDGYLMLRKVTKDYVSGETTLELTSHEAILQDSIGYPSDLAFAFTSLRSIINFVLADTIGALTQLQPGASDYTYSPAYSFLWLPNLTAWDILDALVKAANLVLFCDEKGDWYLNPASSTSGDLYLKDDDNITMLSSTIDRNSQTFFDYAVVEYRNEGSVPVYKNFGTSGFPISKDAYFLVENVEPPAAPANAAQSMVWRAETRGIIYNVEAISNYDARPRQNMTIDVTGEAVKTAIIQSISWSLPSARMSVDIRDLQEVI